MHQNKKDDKQITSEFKKSKHLNSFNTSKWINTQLLKNLSINSRKKDFLTNQHNRQLKFEHKKKSSKKNITELKEIEPKLAKKRSSSAKINKIKFDHLLENNQQSINYQESNQQSINLQESNYFIGGNISSSKEEVSDRSSKKKFYKEWSINSKFSKGMKKKSNKMNGCISPNMVMKSINKEEYKSIFITNKSFKKSKNKKYKTFISKENQEGHLLTLNDKEQNLNNRSSSSSPKQVMINLSILNYIEF